MISNRERWTRRAIALVVLALSSLPGNHHLPDFELSAESSTQLAHDPAEDRAPRDAPTSAGSPLVDIEHIADAIGHCESRNIWDGQDGDISNREPRSTASGRWRFTDPTWEWTWEGLIGEDPPTDRAKHANPHDQERAFAALYRSQGLSPWEASRPCWEDRL